MDGGKKVEGPHGDVVAEEDPGRRRGLVGEADGDEKAPRRSQRVASLDVFRGLTVALMILVDGAGGEWPVIGHAPWNGCNLADFVMPSFLFIVGMAIPLSLKRIPDRGQAVRRVVIRTLKLLFWGILLQGGYSHAPDKLTYGVDMKHVRWGGILQLIFSGVEYDYWGALWACACPYEAIPLNKQLYTFSYICVTAGAAGIVFSLLYFLVDILNLLYAFAPLQWIGMNAMLVYVMAAAGIFEGFLNGWYYEGTNNTLVYWVRKHVFVKVWHSTRVGILLYVLFAQILLWALVSGVLHRAGLYWKL
nr:unnamed protein product [Digitaria exilis]